MAEFIPYELIMKKRDGGEHTREEIKYLVESFTADELPDYQMAAWLMAVYFQKMTASERAYLTMAMAESGEMMDLSSVPGIKVDKHSTGGVGDKVSIPLAPLVAVYGVPIPMMSGRGLGHTGGTLDKLESIPGFRTNLSATEFRDAILSSGLAIIGQTDQVAPADKKMYALRDVTATVDSLDLITASILSKKLAEGMDALVLDVKTGSGAFMQKREEAEQLAVAMVEICRAAGKDVVALITDMDQPLGRKIGNALEIEESIETLRGNGPDDLVEIVRELGAWMLVLGGKTGDEEEGKKLIDDAITSGEGLKKFREMIENQGGDGRVVDDLSLLPSTALTEQVVASRSGYITEMNALQVGLSGIELGAGRPTRESELDPGAGIILHKKVGDRVEAGEPLAELRAADRERVSRCARRFENAVTIADTPPDRRPLVFNTIR